MTQEEITKMVEKEYGGEYEGYTLQRVRFGISRPAFRIEVGCEVGKEMGELVVSPVKDEFFGETIREAVERLKLRIRKEGICG